MFGRDRVKSPETLRINWRDARSPASNRPVRPMSSYARRHQESRSARQLVIPFRVSLFSPHLARRHTDAVRRKLLLAVNGRMYEARGGGA